MGKENASFFLIFFFFILRDSIQIDFLRFLQVQSDLLILGLWTQLSTGGRELSLYIDWLKASLSRPMCSNAVLSC